MAATRLTHFLAGVGSIEAALYAESQELYYFLEQKKEIARTQRLAQLGLVQTAWPIARHTRWDFTMLLLDLVRRAKDLPAIHVGSKVQLAAGIRVTSARELLSSWALLLNLGHLHGTFATEAELLFSIKRSTRRREFENELLSTIPDAAVPFALGVLSEERIYSAYQVLAFYRLARLARGHRHLSLWQQILASYVVTLPEESRALTQSRSLFRRARRLAFMSLDSALTPGPLQVRLGELSSAPEALERLLAPGDTPLGGQDELQGLEEFLSREVYNGGEVLRAVASNRAGLRHRIDAGLRSNGLRYVVESAAKTTEHAHHDAPEAVRPVVRGVIGAPFVQVVMPRTRLQFARRRLEDAFERWGRVLGAEVSLTFVQDAAGSQLIYQTHVHNGALANFSCAIAGAMQLHERLRYRVPERPPFDQLEQLIFEGSAQGIIDAALGHFFTGPSLWEWGLRTGRYLCIAGSKTEVNRHLEAVLAETTLSRARSTEIRAVQSRLRYVSASTVFVAMANLIAYKEDRISQLAELDGVILGLDNRRSVLALTLVEAKATRGAEAKCRAQLEEALKGLGVRAGIRRGPTGSAASGSRGQAWVHLRSTYARAG